MHGDQMAVILGKLLGQLLILYNDSLSFSFIKKCLKFFNYGQNMIKRVDILLHNFSAVINHCHNISQKFSIGRGAR